MTPQKTLEIKATYTYCRFRFQNGDGDTVIADAVTNDNDRITIKGVDDESNRLRVNGSYRFFGRWKPYKNKRTGNTENQFCFSAYIEAQPASMAGIIAYLKAAGRGNGIGPAKARAIYQAFGSDSVRILREQPDVVATAIKGLSLKNAKVVAMVLDEKANTEHCSIELMGLLENRGFPKTTGAKAMKLWGNQACEIITRNPPILMRFPRCGFKLTDKMYLDLGHDPGRLKRQALCAWHSIASNTSGSTWFSSQIPINAIKESIAGAEPRPADALKLAKRARILDVARLDGKRLVDQGGSVWFAETKKSKDESFIARHLVDATDEPNRWPNCEKLNASAHQVFEIGRSTTGTIGVFGGSPGTGKTYTAAALVKLLGDASVAICAPTGKAAVRVTEAMQAYGIGQRAKTIHSLLGVEQQVDGGWSFKHNAGNPLKTNFIIVDESSMIDTGLMASLLSARAKGTHILFVGDVNQLPPVGHGAPLRDMIMAGLPYGELREIHRNEGGIVQACADIRDGKRFQCDGNLILDQCSTPEEQTARCIQICKDAKHESFDPIWDVQIVVPVNAKSKVSRRELNKVLQLELNQNPGVKGSPFRVGDKIVNTKNGYYTAIKTKSDEGTGEEVVTNKKGEVYVANGELGRVVEAVVGYTICRLSSPTRTIRIPRSSQTKSDSTDNGGPAKSAVPTTGCSWELGYALSIHKSQGSEWPIVAVVLDEYPGARMVFSREAVYTAISRAKMECHLIGKMETAWRFCKRTQINERKTLLVERYRAEVAGRLLADM